MSLGQPVRMSEVAEAWLKVDGLPFKFTDWPMHREFYDGRYRRTLFKTSRQVAKSTTLCNFSVIECALIPHFSTMYVAPTKETTTRFSSTRLGKVIRYSPVINKIFLNPELADRVFHKQFTNGSEMLLTYASDSAERLRGPSTHRNCFDKDVYVLTKQGWVLVSELTTQDYVADVNDEGVVEWNHPTNIFTKKYTGSMVTFTKRGLHLRVTEDHRMWVNYQLKAREVKKSPIDYVFETASNLVNTPHVGFKMTCKASWQDTAPVLRLFDGTVTRTKKQKELVIPPYEAFARLTGWYLAEGSIRKRSYANSDWVSYRACITQRVGSKLDDITRTLDQCGVAYYLNTSARNDVVQVVIHSETLGQYFSHLGKCRDRYIPREFFEDPRLLKQVLQGIYSGDASYHKGEQWEHGTLRTRSRRLAEDVQEAWLRLGRPAVIHTRQMARNKQVAKEPLYEVCAYNRDYYIFWNWDFARKQQVVVTPTKNENVFCFTVKNHRPIVKGDFGSVPVITSQCYDEVQDILYDPVITVGNETLANSPHQFEMYAGTPLTMENTIQYLWDISTQTEWVMKCGGCGSYQFIDSEKSIGKDGPICLKCGAYLDSFTGQWIDMSPVNLTAGEDPDTKIKGFHLSQLIMPFNNPAAMRGRGTEAEEIARRRWRRILGKCNENPISVVRNEVIGVSDSIGARMLSKEELVALCTDRRLVATPTSEMFQGFNCTVAGIDWSGGGTTGISRTVLWIWGWNTLSQKLVCLYYKVYPGINPVNVIDEIAQTCNAYHTTLVVGDAGEGHTANNLLRNKLGAHRVHQVQYGAQKEAFVWNGVDRWAADRTTLIDNYFMGLKKKEFEFASYPDMEIAIADILNEYEEITSANRRVWRHSPQKPDDALHAGLFGWVAFKMHMNDLRFYQ